MVRRTPELVSTIRHPDDASGHPPHLGSAGSRRLHFPRHSSQRVDPALGRPDDVQHSYTTEGGSVMSTFEVLTEEISGETYHAVLEIWPHEHGGRWEVVVHYGPWAFAKTIDWDPKGPERHNMLVIAKTILLGLVTDHPRRV